MKLAIGKLFINGQIINTASFVGHTVSVAYSSFTNLFFILNSQTI